MKPIIYGIPNCDSIRKARQWFEANGIEYTFVDFRQSTLSRDKVARWIEAAGHKILINKRSTTWKQMKDSDRHEVEHGDSLSVLLAHPTLIKRPVLEHQDNTIVGFSADDYASRFGVGIRR